jgi:hypothetical protein
MGLFLLNPLFDLIDVLAFLGQEIEVNLKAGINDQGSLVVMGDSPQPDRGPALMGLMVEVQEPEVKSQLETMSGRDSVKSFAPLTDTLLNSARD